MSQGKQLDLDHQHSSLSHYRSNVNSLYDPGPPDSEPRVGIILDTANLGASAAIFGGRPPYPKLIRLLARNRPWIGTAVVLARHWTAGINRFSDHLRHIGLSVITSYRRDVFGRSKASDDVVLAAEAACAVLDPTVSELILCTGDGDLEHVISIAHRAGKPCTVAAYGHALSSVLRRAADRVIELGASDVVTEAA